MELVSFKGRVSYFNMISGILLFNVHVEIIVPQKIL